MAKKKTMKKAVKKPIKKSIKKSIKKAAKTKVKAPVKKPVKKPVKTPVKTPAKKLTKKAPKKISAKAKKSVKPSNKKSSKTPKATKTTAVSPKSQTPKPNVTAFLKPQIEVGNLVPDFTVESSSGQKVTLSSLEGQKVILYFYPKDDTPGCTLEGQEFNKHLKEFQEANTKVFGISRDTVASHCKFIDKYGYQFELLSDPDEMLCQLFDVIKEKNMYGKTVMGIERSTFVIDEKGNLIGEFRKIRPEGHAEQMLQFVRSR